MRTIRLRSPSKINLHLRVAGPDASGFHPLRSWFVTTDLCDELTCRLDATPGQRAITMTCDVPTIPTDAGNLVVRAARAYLQAIDSLEPGAGDATVHFELTKRVPAGAGLGGGSGNAAAALLGMATLLPCEPTVALAPLAAMLGSDVPFFLGSASAVATGRGEQLADAPTPRARVALLLLPAFHISTPQAYRTLDQLRPHAPPETLDGFDVHAWATLDARSLAPRLINDLEPAAFAREPDLAALRSEAERRLGRPVRMSGSGSTLFALYDEPGEAAAADSALRDALPTLRTHVVRLGEARVAAQPVA